MLSQITGVSFGEAWPARLTLSLVSEDGSTPLHLISVDHLVANKRATGRAKDLADLNYLRGLDSP